MQSVWPTTTSAPMPPLDKRRIAGRYLPSRYHYWYARSKLTLDPLYDDVRHLLLDDHKPLLDLGCGIGLILHCLRASGISSGYVGVDIDAAKIAIARGTLQ